MARLLKPKRTDARSEHHQEVVERALGWLRDDLAPFIEGGRAEVSHRGRRYSRLELSGRLEGVDVSLELRIYEDGRRSSTMHYRAAAPECFPIRMRAANALDRFGRWLGWVADVPTGSPALDERLIVDTASPIKIWKVLRESDLEQTLLALFDVPGVGELSIGAGAVRAARPLDDFGPGWARNEVGERSARALICVARIARVVGRERVQLTVHGLRPKFAWTVAGQARCPYCKDRLSIALGELRPEPVVACDGCGTLHHAACFAEARSCTVYGCRSRSAAAAGG